VGLVYIAFESIDNAFLNLFWEFFDNFFFKDMKLLGEWK
jgi:hypothetical protein